jgi:hypothetical protein
MNIPNKKGFLVKSTFCPSTPERRDCWEYITAKGDLNRFVSGTARYNTAKLSPTREAAEKFARKHGFEVFEVVETV